MKENRMKDMLESIAQRDVPENINIWPHIAAKVERKDFMQTVRTRPALAMLLVLLALALLSTVAYAIGKATGYIPGVGIVDQSMPLRVLAEPVVVEKDGLTVTVSEVVADTDHTFVAYTVDGILVPREGRPVCGAIPSLQLPNGSMLEVVNLDDGGPQGARVGSVIKLEQSVTYSSIPADVNTVTFTFPCILEEGKGPENWQIPFTVSPAPKNYATPAVEIGATFVSSNPGSVPTSLPADAATPASSASSISPSIPNGSGLYLDKVIELPDSYILVGNFTDAGDLPGGMEIDLDPNADLPHIEDGAGNRVDFKVRDDIQPATTWGDRYWVRNWAYEIPKSVQGPLTITMDQINIGVANTSQFKFDAGSDPQPGQKWELNLPIQLGKYEYVMDSVEMVEGGYLFQYHSGVDVPAGQSLLFNILGTSPERNDSALNAQKTTVEYSERVTFSPAPPTGSITVELTLNESVPLQGPWTLTWTTPSR
jgi:hypothetical protein